MNANLGWVNQQVAEWSFMAKSGSPAVALLLQYVYELSVAPLRTSGLQEEQKLKATPRDFC